MVAPTASAFPWRHRLHWLRELWYAPMLALAMALGMFRTLVLAGILDVGEFAAFSGAMLVSSTFCMVGGLGMPAVLQRDWPRYALEGRRRRAVVGAIQCYSLLLLTAALCAAAALAGVADDWMNRRLLVAGILHGATQQAFMVATIASRSEGRVRKYALQQLIKAMCVLVAGILAARVTGSAMAVVVVELLLALFLSLTLLRRTVLRNGISGWTAIRAAHRRLPWLRWRPMLTLMVASFVAFALLNVDRWVAAIALSRGAFAHYSFIATLLAIAQATQALINASVYPLLARRIVRAGRASAFNVCVRITLLLVCVGLLAVPILDLGLSYCIQRWYPAYTDTLDVSRLLLLVAVLRVSNLWPSFLIAAGHETRLLVVNLLAIAAGSAVWALLAMPHAGELTSIRSIGLLAASLSVISTVVFAMEAWRTRDAGI